MVKGTLETFKSKGSLSNLAKNLKRYRTLSSFSQEELAKKAGIGRVTYTNIEAGKEEPRVANLQKIAIVLGVDLFKLLAPVPKIASLRFRSNKKLISVKMRSLQEQVKVDFAYWLKNFNYLEDILGEKRKFNLENVCDTDKDPIELAKAAREALGLHKDKGVINDICGLVESAGIKVYTFKQDTKCGFGFCINQNDGGPAIAVNDAPEISTERKIFTVAHELGHILLHPGSFNGQEKSDDKEEEDADVFAGYFLMPQHEFLKKYREYFGLHPVDRILTVKRYFKVSYKTVLKRLSVLTSDNSVYLKFGVAYKKRYNKDLKNHKEPLPIADKLREEPEALGNLDFSEDRLSCLVRQALEEDSISLHQAGEILGKTDLEMSSIANQWETAKQEKLEWSF